MVNGMENLMPFGILWSTLSVYLGLLIILSIALYVYTAFVFMTIAKKLKYDKPWLAWIPIANLFLIPILAKKRWEWGFIFIVPIVGVVFYFIWMWRIYELRKYPGWLSLIPILTIIPILNIFAWIGDLVVKGLVAWADRK